MCSSLPEMEQQAAFAEQPQGRGTGLAAFAQQPPESRYCASRMCSNEAPAIHGDCSHISQDSPGNKDYHVRNTIPVPRGRNRDMGMVMVHRGAV